MSFAVADFHDLLRLFEERPEWQAALRRLVLTNELLSMPEQLAALRAEMEQAFQKMAEAQARTDERLASLIVRMEELAEAQKRTDRRLVAMSDDIGEMKGRNLEADYRTKGHAYFSRMVRCPHVLSSHEIVALVEGTCEREALSDSQAREIYDADVIVRGKR